MPSKEEKTIPVHSMNTPRELLHLVQEIEQCGFHVTYAGEIKGKLHLVIRKKTIQKFRESFFGV